MDFITCVLGSLTMDSGLSDQTIIEETVVLMRYLKKECKLIREIK